MDKILERIMETDRTAREKVNSSKRRLETINDEIISAREQIDLELSKKVRSSVENTRKEADRKKENETARIDKYFCETEEKLNRSYEENRERWVNEIVGEVTK